MSEHEHKSCALNLDVACCICQPHGCHLSSPQQQPEEEPIGANLDQTGEETLNRLKEAAKNLTGSEEHSCNPNEAHQQQPECKCKKTGTFVTFTGDCPIHAPQQTEQWMEEFDEKFGLDDMHTVWFHRNDIKSFIKSQLEAAKQDIGKKSEYELARKVWSIVAYKDSDKNLVALLLPILEAGRAASITNHN